MYIDFDRGRWSPSTRSVYSIAWQHFTRYCVRESASPLPAQAATVAGFLREHSETHKTATVSQALAAIVAAHDLAGHELKVKGTEIRDAWADIRRTKGSMKTPKAAMVADNIRAAVDRIPADRLLDQAVLLFGFKSLMRRSEIVALDVADLQFTDDALFATIRRSKTDKEGKGETVAILRTGGSYCAVEALETWLKADGISEGAVFRNRRGGRLAASEVAAIVKRWGKAAGFDPRQLGAHSMRRGGITTMFRNGAKIEDIMKHSRHATVSIALGYVEAQQAERNPAIRALGL